MHTYEAWALILLLSVLLKVTYSITRANRLRKIMPPGPPGLPLLGNIFQLGEFQWLRFTEWKEQYGSIFSLNLAGQPVVVLNDFTTAADLADRRSGIYSDRPRFIVANEILTGGMLIALLSCGDLWRRMRRASHDGFSPRASTAYQPMQEKESALLLLRMLEGPENWNDNFKRSASSMLLNAVYGWLSLNENAETLIKRIEGVMHRITCACLPGTYLVEIFPSMKLLPDWAAKWKRDGRRWFKNATIFFEGLLDDVKIRMEKGSSEPCFGETLLENLEKCGLNAQEGAWLAGTMLGAGSRSIAGCLNVFMLAMIFYPDVMRRAQAEIDEVVGRERLPSFSDRERLPYIEAIVKEVLRWRSVGPLGMPRCSNQDDWYNGHFIPKGTLVLLNIWAMNRDPKLFPDYEDFRPERYLNASGGLSNSIPDTHEQGHLTYGAGRRVCVGKDISNQSLFINIAAMLWAFNIEKAVDECGNAIVPSRTECIDDGLVVCPAPFRCSITPRSLEVPAMIQAGAASYLRTKSD